MVNVVTRRRSRRSGTVYKNYNVFFLCCTGSPNTFICEEAMKVLLGKNADDVVPEILLVQMANLPAVWAHLSPKGGRFHDVNVIGMDILSQLKTTILGKDLKFVLENMEYTVS